MCCRTDSGMLKMHPVSAGMQEIPSLRISLCFVLFALAATAGAEVSSNEEQIAGAASNQCWEN